MDQSIILQTPDALKVLSFLGQWLRKMLKTPDDHYAAVFDIDHTILKPDPEHDDLSIPLLPWQALYRFLIQNNVHVFFVTARVGTPSNLAATKLELNELGYLQYDNIYFLNPAYTQMFKSAFQGRGPKQQIAQHNLIGGFKWFCRQHIAQLGYTILLNTGDTMWDCAALWVEGAVPTFVAEETDSPEHMLFHSFIRDPAMLSLKLPRTDDDA